MAQAQFDAIPGHSFQLELRYHATPTHRNVADETSLFHFSPNTWLHSDLVARLSETSAGLNEFEYSGELSLSPVGFFDLNFRIVHGLRLADTTSATTFLPYFRLHVSPFEGFTIFGSFGWYERLVQISRVAIIPTPWRNDINENDFAGEFGFQYRWNSQMLTIFKLSTFETLDVFNLNNPFAETDVQFCPSGKSYCALAYTRYQVLLGFGDLEEVMVGVGIALKNPFEE